MNGTVMTYGVGIGLVVFVLALVAALVVMCVMFRGKATDVSSEWS